MHLITTRFNCSAGNCKNWSYQKIVWTNFFQINYSFQLKRNKKDFWCRNFGLKVRFYHLLMICHMYIVFTKHDKKKVADYVPQSKKFRNQSDSNAILFRSMKTLYYLDHTPLWMLNMKLKYRTVSVACPLPEPMGQSSFLPTPRAKQFLNP